MESSWFGPMRVRRLRIVTLFIIAAAIIVSIPVAGSAQFAQAADRDALDRLVSEAGARGLPVAPLTSKIREGFSKGATVAAIESVVRQLAAHLETANSLVREPSVTGAEREAAVTLLADALEHGVTADEVGHLQRQSQVAGRPPAPPGGLAAAAKGLSLIKEAKLPATDGTAVMVEALRQRFRSHEMIDLGREIKSRERDYREGRASLVALRDAIARGNRPDQLFRDSRRTTVDRPAATRPDPVTTTRERAQPPERPTRHDRSGTDRVR